MTSHRTASLLPLRQRSQPVRNEVPRLPPHASWRDAGLFALLSGLYLLPCMRVLLPWSNEGTLASGAVRVLHGEVFARDFFEVMGPGSFYLIAAFFKMLGPTFFALRLYVFLISWGTALAIYSLARAWHRNDAMVACLLLVATSYGLQWPGASHHVDSNFFSLCAVLCLACWHEQRSMWLPFAAGLLAGVAATIHQPKGALLLMALMLWLLVGSHRNSAARWATLRLLAGFGTVLLFVLWFFWRQNALGALFAANVLWPVQHYGPVNHVPYGLGIFSQYWRQWTAQAGHHAWFRLFASVLVVPFLYVAALPVVVGSLLLQRRRADLGPTGRLYLLSGVGLFLSEWHRHDIYHLVFASPLLLLVSLDLLRSQVWRLAGVCRQVVAITAGTLACVNLLTACIARPVPTRAGMVGLYRDSGLLEAMQTRVQPGETIFVYPYRPLYYFLTDTRNPTRYLTLTYNYNTTEEFKDAIQSLEQKRIRFVVWDLNFQREAAARVFAKEARDPPAGPIMEQYLQSHYVVVEEIEGVRLLERKPPDASHRAADSN